MTIAQGSTTLGIMCFARGAIDFGSGGFGKRMTGIFKSIERWASESDDRVRLLMILIWAALGVIVLIAILTAAWIMLPPDFKLF